MIPDKIYSIIILDEPTPGNTRGVWSCVEVEGALNTEYIRKDALLEWLENKIKIPDISFINGLTYLAYKDVIEHINEM